MTPPPMPDRRCGDPGSIFRRCWKKAQPPVRGYDTKAQNVGIGYDVYPEASLRRLWVALPGAWPLVRESCSYVVFPGPGDGPPAVSYLANVAFYPSRRSVSKVRDWRAGTACDARVIWQTSR